MISALMILGHVPLPNRKVRGRVIKDRDGFDIHLPNGIRPGTVASEIWPLIPSKGDGVQANELKLIEERSSQSIQMALYVLSKRGLIKRINANPYRYIKTEQGEE